MWTHMDTYAYIWIQIGAQDPGHGPHLASGSRDYRNSRITTKKLMCFSDTVVQIGCLFRNRNPASRCGARSPLLLKTACHGMPSIAHVGPPPVLGQCLASGPPYVSIYIYIYIYTYVHIQICVEFVVKFVKNVISLSISIDPIAVAMACHSNGMPWRVIIQFTKLRRLPNPSDTVM